MAVKTNERPGTRAVLRHSRMSGYKAREVLDLIRGVEYTRATEILAHCERAAAPVIEKLVRSAAANAEHNDGLDPEELYVASCYADEGATLKRWRPRARGRATRIRKRTCHITVVLARLPEDQIARRRARVAAEAAERRARRVAGTRRRARAEVQEAPVSAPARAEEVEVPVSAAPAETLEATTREVVAEAVGAQEPEGATEAVETTDAEASGEEEV